MISIKQKNELGVTGYFQVIKMNRNVFRPIGAIGEGVISLAFDGSVAEPSEICSVFSRQLM